MSDLPKFLSPVLVTHTGFMYAVDSSTGYVDCWSPGDRAVAVDKRGQRPKGGVWPDGFGVVELEDIPKPEPLRPAYYMRSRLTGALGWFDDGKEIHGWSLVATVTFDADDNATVVRA